MSFSEVSFFHMKLMLHFSSPEQMVDVDILTLLSNRPSVRVDTGYWNACVSSFQKYLGQFQPKLAQIMYLGQGISSC